MGHTPNTTASTSASIKIDKVGLDFDPSSRALANVDLKVEPSEFVSVVGPSGCGKSSLLRLMAGLIQPTLGSVDVKSPSGSQSDQDSKNPKVGFVFQQANLLPWRDVLGNIGLPLELAGVDKEKRQSAATEAREWVGLREQDQAKWPRELSGGMQMRVAVARALVSRPDLLLMDEPFAAIDDLLRSRLNEEIVALWQQQGWTAVFVTHNVAEAVFVSQRVVVMSQAPGTIHASFNVPFPYPRKTELRGTAEFARLTHEVTTSLHSVSGDQSENESGHQRGSQR